MLSKEGIVVGGVGGVQSSTRNACQWEPFVNFVWLLEVFGGDCSICNQIWWSLGQHFPLPTKGEYSSLFSIHLRLSTQIQNLKLEYLTKVRETLSSPRNYHISLSVQFLSSDKIILKYPNAYLHLLQGRILCLRWLYVSVIRGRNWVPLSHELSRDVESGL